MLMENENQGMIKYLTQEEVARLFAKIHSKRDRAMFNVVYKYGLRIAEVGLLKIDDVDLRVLTRFVRKCTLGICRPNILLNYRLHRALPRHNVIPTKERIGLLTTFF